jgi:GTP cyclohydrolase II
MPSPEQNDNVCRVGDPLLIGVERGLGEIRAGRPIIITDQDDASFVALPVDGLDDLRLADFIASCGATQPRLAMTARRARAIGIEAPGPVALKIDHPTAAGILSLASDVIAAPHTEIVPAPNAIQALLDLAKIAERLPAALFVETRRVTAIFDPPLISVPALAVAQFRKMTLRSLKIVGEANVPLEGGVRSRFVVFRDGAGNDAVAVVVGQPDFSKSVPVRLHSACLTGDVFGSRRCDCGDQLRLALGELAGAGGGVILYLDQEGRGLGLANKMRAYRLQDAGFDTVDANISLGFDDDERDYEIAGWMLEMLGCRSVQLLTNNPAKIAGLRSAGVEISDRIPLLGPVNVDNRRYLRAKATRNGHSFGHLLETLIAGAEPARPEPAEEAAEGPQGGR